MAVEKTLDAGRKQILEKVVAKWKGREGNLIMILHEIQKEMGYVPREISLELSQQIDVPLAKIYEVLSFYHFFKLTPPAKNQVAVCTGTACYLKGAPDLIKGFEKELGVSDGKTTADGEFSLSSVRCVGCCGLAPVVSVNGKIYGQVKPTEVRKIVEDFRGKK
ncbi:NADH-quinone oxidoreductase subunit E [Parelusimicrobium proximum]|uniref:NADH-quinone oxidoreductase subunit NuoE family protein n=1 Tax=Parelusimicrobium proximum TaxID=3228953 RepID=UPI003D17C2B0